MFTLYCAASSVLYSVGRYSSIREYIIEDHISLYTMQRPGVLQYITERTLGRYSSIREYIIEDHIFLYTIQRPSVFCVT